MSTADVQILEKSETHDLDEYRVHFHALCDVMDSVSSIVGKRSMFNLYYRTQQFRYLRTIID